jgi:hypothetical protein
MSKIFRRSSCQKASDGTDGAHRWRFHFRPSAALQMQERLTQGVSVARTSSACNALLSRQGTSMVRTAVGSVVSAGETTSVTNPGGERQVAETVDTRDAVMTEERHGTIEGP